jgi:uncharacterized membrane protein
MGLMVWPAVRKIFTGWENGAYLLAKTCGLLGTGLLVWLAGSIGIKFTFENTIFLMVGLGLVVWIRKKQDEAIEWKKVAKDESVFVIALLIWTFIKGHAPDINGLEKFMDFGFAQSIYRNGLFPPQDMWFAGKTINYYYFGHLLMAILSKLSQVDLAYGFNLMLSTIFAMAFSMSFAIGRELLAAVSRGGKFWGGIFIGIVVTLSGNLQTIYAFTKGYQSEPPPPFWQILSNPFKKGELEAGIGSYWYPNATRFIPYTIHEFPAYSFVVSDIHGHVLAIPIVLLLIALLVNYWKHGEAEMKKEESIVYGIVAGTAMMTNALDGPIYIGLLLLVQIIRQWPVSRVNGKKIFAGICLTGGVMLVTMAPFLAHFKPFVSGIAVNCPPSFLAEKTFGPIIFEGAEKCQKSPLWMMLVLWGGFVYWGGVMLKAIPGEEKYKKMAIGFAILSLGLIIFPELFYFKDIYPLHFRSNTMFKLGYQAFILMSFVSGWTICYLVWKIKQIKKAKLCLLAGLPLVFLVLIYPYFAVKSYFGNLEEYKGIYGLEWMKKEYPENWMVVNWFNSQSDKKTDFYILEAQGDSYQDPITNKPYNQISAFTGIPTVAGWYVHEWLWRGQDLIAKRAEDVREIYETGNSDRARELLKTYQVEYVIVGEMEREKYKYLNEEKFTKVARPVYTAGQTKVYEVI